MDLYSTAERADVRPTVASQRNQVALARLDVLMSPANCMPNCLPDPHCQNLLGLREPLRPVLRELETAMTEGDKANVEVYISDPEDEEFTTRQAPLP